MAYYAGSGYIDDFLHPRASAPYLSESTRPQPQRTYIGQNQRQGADRYADAAPERNPDYPIYYPATYDTTFSLYYGRGPDLGAHASPYTQIITAALQNPDDFFYPLDPYGFRTIDSYYDGKPHTSPQWVIHYFDQTIRQIYRHFLLRLPSMYFTRVSKIFRLAKVRGTDVEKLRGSGTSEALRGFQTLWSEFVDILIKEWKTLNVVSALLLSAILTLLQIDDAANQAVTRTTAFMSLVSALMSLIFGCLYIIRFGTMKNRNKAARFVEVIRRSRASIWWNVLVLLALPAIWLAWSLLLFCASILSFLWTAGGNSDSPMPPSASVELILRIVVSVFFSSGLLFLVLVMRDLSLHQGELKPSQPAQSYSSEGIPARTPLFGSQPVAPIPPLIPLPQGITPSPAHYDASAAGYARYSASPNYNESWPAATTRNTYELDLAGLAPSPGNFGRYFMANNPSGLTPVQGPLNPPYYGVNQSYNLPPPPNVPGGYTAAGVSQWSMPYQPISVPVPPTPFVPPTPIAPQSPGADNSTRRRRRRRSSDDEENNASSGDQPQSSPHVRFVSVPVTAVTSPPSEAPAGPVNSPYSHPQNTFPPFPPPYRPEPMMDAGEGWDELEPSDAYPRGFVLYPVQQQMPMPGTTPVSPPHPMRSVMPVYRSPYGLYPVSSVIAEPPSANPPHLSPTAPSSPAVGGGAASHPMSVNRRVRRPRQRLAGMRASRRRADRERMLSQQSQHIPADNPNAGLQVNDRVQEHTTDGVIEALSGEDTDASDWETAASH